MTSKPESILHRKIKRELKKQFLGSWWMKVHGGPHQMAGVPDLIGCVNSLFIALEVKIDDNHEASEIQKEQIKRIKRAGGTARVIATPEGAVRAVRSALALSKKGL